MFSLSWDLTFILFSHSKRDGWVIRECFCRFCCFQHSIAAAFDMPDLKS